jgi:hypothetical protein
VYTKEGIDWVEENSMITVLKRHFPPSSRPALRDKESAFHPWNVTQTVVRSSSSVVGNHWTHTRRAEKDRRCSRGCVRSFGHVHAVGAFGGGRRMAGTSDKVFLRAFKWLKDAVG